MTGVTRPAPPRGWAARRSALMLVLVPAIVLVAACSHDPAARLAGSGEETVVAFDALPVGVAGWAGWPVVLEQGAGELVEARFIDVEPGLDVPEVRAVRRADTGGSMVTAARDDRGAPPALPDRGPAGMPVGDDPEPEWYLLIRVVASEPGRHQARNLEITLDVDGHPVRHVERLVLDVDAV
jgi:hypothetical protein